MELTNETSKCIIVAGAVNYPSILFSNIQNPTSKKATYSVSFLLIELQVFKYV